MKSQRRITGTSVPETMIKRTEYPITTIKIYHLGDVRRFSAHCVKDKPEYSGTIKQIEKAYSLDKESINIGYTDEDGDSVSIMSTMELQYAFKNLKVGETCLRLSVLMKIGDLPSPQEEIMHTAKSTGKSTMKEQEERLLVDKFFSKTGSEEEKMCVPKTIYKKRYNETHQTARERLWLERNPRNITRTIPEKKNTGSMWMMDTYMLKRIAANSRISKTPCHHCCVDVCDDAAKGYVPVCFVLLYHICINHGIIPNTEEEFSYTVCLNKWNANSEIFYYLSLFDDIAKVYARSNLMEYTIGIGHKLGHFKASRTVKKMGELYALSKVGKKYVNMLSSPEMDVACIEE